MMQYLVRNNELLRRMFINTTGITLFLLNFGINAPSVFVVVPVLLGTLFIIGTRHKGRNYRNISLILCFFIILISALISNPNNEAFKLVERSLIFLLFPLVLIFVNLDSDGIKVMLKYLIIGVLLSLIINLFISTYNSLSLNNGVLVIDSSVLGGYQFSESFNKGGNYFFGEHFSNFIHPSYQSMYVLVLLTMLPMFGFSKTKHRLLMSLLLIYLFLLASKASFLIILVLLLTYYFKSKNKFVLLGLILILLGMLFSPRIHYAYKALKNLDSKTNYNYTTSSQSRLFIWSAAFHQIYDKPILGYGVDQGQDTLLSSYKEKGFLTLYNKKLNTHNQYLQSLIYYGFLGLIVMVIPLVLLIKDTKNKYSMYVGCIFFISFLFESMLVRFNGICFYVILTGVFFSYNNNKLKDRLL